jgi:translation initiation factor eIF-2B subunit alpha
VEALLLRAATVEKKRFKVIVLEGRPDAGGAKSAKTYDAAGIPTVLILDSAMGYIAERTRIDMVLVGAEGVAENGGVVNKVGTFALGIVAKELGVPFYVAAESYKFTRMFPLNNADLPEVKSEEEDGAGLRLIKFLDTLSWSGDGGGKSSEAQDGSSNNSSSGGGLEKYLVDLPKSISVENPPCDFTPAKYITLLFTDLGVLTPSAVSDELIRLYQ